MSNPNCNQQPADGNSPPASHAASPTATVAPATEAELEAIRYRGASLPQTVSEAKSQNIFSEDTIAKISGTRHVPLN